MIAASHDGSSSGRASVSVAPARPVSGLGGVRREVAGGAGVSAADGVAGCARSAAGRCGHEVAAGVRSVFTLGARAGRVSGGSRSVGCPAHGPRRLTYLGRMFEMGLGPVFDEELAKY